MSRQVVDTTTQTSAAAAAIWPLLADTTTWSDWGKWTHAELLREGTPAPFGVHAVRRLKSFPATTVDEEITVFEPEKRLGYELRKGLPLKGYRAEVTLTPVDGGTEIRWHSEFEPKVPGTGGFYRRVMSSFMADAAKRLGAAAEKR